MSKQKQMDSKRRWARNCKARGVPWRGVRPSAERLEPRQLLSAVVAAPDPVVAAVAHPLPPRPGHTFYVQGIPAVGMWDQDSAITPNTVNDLILHAAPIDSNYVPNDEAVTAPEGNNPTQPNTIGILTNGTTQSLRNASGQLDQAGTPDGGVADPSDPTNVIADLDSWHATYSLGNNPNGYDVSEIDSITGHHDNRTQQQIDVEVEPVGSTQFFSLSGGQGFSFTQTGGASPVTLLGGSAQMAIVSDAPGRPIATNIKAIRFDNLPGDVAFFRELVVSGVASTSTPHAPAAPTNLTAVADPIAGGVRLSWTDNADNEFGYLVQRATSPNGPFATIASLPADPGTGQTVPFLDTSITATGNYYYQVVASGPNFGSPPSTSNVAGPVAILGLPGATAHYFNQGFWTGSPTATTRVDTVDFIWQSGLPDPSIQFDDNNSSAFTGKITTNEAGVYTFVGNSDDDGYVYVDGVLVSADPGAHGQRDASRLVPLTLAAHTQYDFVFLQDNEGTLGAVHMQWVTPSAKASGQLTPQIIPQSNLYSASDVPDAPSSLALDAAVSPNPIALSAAFTFTADNNAVWHYELQRSTDGGQSWQVASQADPGSAHQAADGSIIPANLRITDPAPPPGQSALYRVVAVNFDGISAPSNVLSVAVPGVGVQAPGVEVRFYNGTVASQNNGQDPRNALVAGAAPVESAADSSGTVGGAAGPIDAAYTTTSPDPTPYPDIQRIHPTAYASVWTGKIVTDQAGLYTFLTSTDDDGYLYVNDVLVSADPGMHAEEAPKTIVPVQLAAQTAYNLVLIQQQDGGPSAVRARWIEPGQSTPTTIPAFAPAVLGRAAIGGFEQISDVPHQQVLTPSGVYSLDDPTASAAGELRATANPSGTVQLSWTDQSLSELWFEVQRSADTGATWASIGQTGFNTGSFTDSGVTDAGATKAYEYRVRGVNFDGAGPWGDVASTAVIQPTTPQLVAQACAAGMVHLLVSGQSPLSGGIEIQQSLDGSSWADVPGSPIAATANSFDVTGLNPADTYFFRARNLAGPTATAPSDYSSSVSASAGGPQPIAHQDGFASVADLSLNGAASVAAAPDGGATQTLQPAAASNEAVGGAFATAVQNVGTFDTSFDFAIPQQNAAGGFTFTIQNSPAGPLALGPSADGLGYGPGTHGGPGGIPSSVAVKFDLFNNEGEGADSTGLFVNGDAPTLATGANSAEASLDMSLSGLNLHSPGDTFRAELAYNGAVLHETITDLVFRHSSLG